MNIIKLKQQAKFLKNLSYDEEVPYEKSLELRKQAKFLMDKVIFITTLRELCNKKKEKK